MTLVIELSPEMEQRLKEATARVGQAPDEFARAAVEARLAGDDARTRMASLLQRSQAHSATVGGDLEEVEAEIREECEVVREAHHRQRTGNPG